MNGIPRIDWLYRLRMYQLDRFIGILNLLVRVEVAYSSLHCMLDNRHQ